MSMLNEKGVPYVFRDDWYDFEVNGNIKVEVKSCRLAVRHSQVRKRVYYQIGKFDFTNEDNRESQEKENIWVCFIVRHYSQAICLGFIKAKDISVKKRMRKTRKLKKTRYISIIQARELKLIDIDDWIKEINKHV